MVLAWENPREENAREPGRDPERSGMEGGIHDAGMVVAGRWDGIPSLVTW